MIKENKVSKYLLYAIGEIILVMVGILLAVQVNNWNENRKLQKEELNLLLELKWNLEVTLNNFKKDTLSNLNTIHQFEKIESYILDLVFATRNPENYKLKDLKPLLSYGASPRASINLALAAKAYAFLKHRGYVIPEDVRAICADVMRHRIGLSYEAEAEEVTAEDVVRRVFEVVEVP